MNKYRTEQARLKSAKISELLKELPTFLEDYFIGINNTTSAYTRLAYAYELRIFFLYLIEENSKFSSYKLTDFKLDDMEKITFRDIERFLVYLDNYKLDEMERANSPESKARKLSTIRSMLQYFYTRELISRNVATLVKTPKLSNKEIVSLDVNEMVLLLEHIQTLGNVDGMNRQRLACYKKTMYRDYAILSLFLGTGIRVTELVGLDLRDINLSNCTVRVERKGQKEQTIDFNDEVSLAIGNYLEYERSHIEPLNKNENALFLSLQRNRLSVRAVQVLVKKYCGEVEGIRAGISAHKLRSSFATILLQETYGDVRSIQEILGHSRLETTARYAKNEKARLRDIMVNTHRLRKV